MDNKLYKMMNWPEIESIIYSECDHPHEILGKHASMGGTLIQCYFPGAKSVFLNKLGSKNPIEMQEVDENGFFAFWTIEKNVPDYDYNVLYEDREVCYPESYLYLPKLDKAVIDKFLGGTLYDMYDVLGSHITSYKEYKGVSFMVYAPMALRVSVVGDFNNWDGRFHQMTRLGESGIFSIFIPYLKEDMLYKFEIKLNNGHTFLKRDPFSFKVEDNSGNASIVENDEYFRWNDSSFIIQEKYLNNKERPLAFGEILVKNFVKEGIPLSESLKNIVNYIKTYDYCAVIFDNLSKDINGNILSLFSLAGFDKNDIKYLINGLHEVSIPVFYTLDLSSFSCDNEGLSMYDGRKLYESIDCKTIDGKYTFDFSKKYVRNFVISVAFYYIKLFHVDGFVLRGTDRILYLNYSRPENDFLPNMYGGYENLGGEEFVKHLNSIIHKKYPEFITIAGDSLNSNNLTTNLDNSGFGFDYKYDNHIHESMHTYFTGSAIERKLHYSELTNVLINAYCEHFVLLLPTWEYGNNEEMLVNDFPGDISEKYANFRCMLTAFYAIPGRKCLPFTDFKDERLVFFLKDLQNLYYSNSAMNLDYDKDSFEWLDTTDSERSFVAFLRKGYDEELLILCNFSDKSRTVSLKFKNSCKYKEYFISNDIKYGGDKWISDTSLSAVLLNPEDKYYILTTRLDPISIKIYSRIL